MSLRLIQVRSSEDAPPPMASGVPQVVVDVTRKIGLTDVGVPLRDRAIRLTGDKDGAWLLTMLLNANRTQPVIAISGEIDASADRLARRLVGVAHVVCIDLHIAERLIRSFGRERAVFGNALRLYRPGVTADCNPYLHPVWTLRGTQLPKWLANDVFEEACAISVDIGDLDDRAPSFQLVRSHLARKRLAVSEARMQSLRRQAEEVVLSKEETIRQLSDYRDASEHALSVYRAKNEELGSEVDELTQDLQATRRERDQALEEVRQLRYQLSNQWVGVVTEPGPSEEDDEVEFPDTWDDLETWIELYGQDKLVLHDKAAKAARSSPFKDISLAYKAMNYLVRQYVPMRQRDLDDRDALDRSKQALAELGLEESDVGTAKDSRRYKQEYRRQYGDREVTLDRHLKKGVGFGGDFQFRLYFYYDDDAGKVLIGHMPTHLTNRLSHNG